MAYVRKSGKVRSGHGIGSRSSAPSTAFAVAGEEGGGGERKEEEKKGKNEVVEKSVILCFCPRESRWKWLCFRERAVRPNLNSCRLYMQRHTRARACTDTHAGALPLLQVCMCSWQILHANVPGFVFIIKLQMF